MSKRFFAGDSCVIDTMSGLAVAIPHRLDGRYGDVADILNFVVSSVEDDLDASLADPVSALYRVWLQDPCWELEDTPGFGMFREELLAMRLTRDAALADSKDAKDAAHAAGLGVSVALARRIDSLREGAKKHKDDSKALLVHYLTQAGVVHTANDVAEIQSIVDRIVDASASEAVASFLLQEGRAVINNSPAAPPAKPE